MDAPPADPPALAPEEIHAVLSHLASEFSQPIHAIRATLERIEIPSFRASGRDTDHSSAMATVCDDLLALTDSYLDYIWITRGGESPCMAPVALSSLLMTAKEQFEAKTSPRRVIAALEGPDAEVQTDATLCAALFNLLADNASRYTPADVTVRVSISRSPNSWSVTVADSGPGIPVEEHDRVLEPFVRLNRDVNAGIPGAGLGLSLCRALVELIKGSIAVSSSAEGGALVRIDVPHRRPPASAAPAKRDREIYGPTRLRTSRIAATLSDVPNF